MIDIIEIDAATGIVTERNFTPEELAQRETDAAEYQAQQAAAAEKAAQNAAARVAAIGHAKSLGFTDEMISVMYPTLVEE